MPATKNGSSGIRKRTKEPKLATVNPTEKAKNKENNIQNKSMGFFLIIEKKPKIFNLKIKKTVKTKR